MTYHSRALGQFTSGMNLVTQPTVPQASSPTSPLLMPSATSSPTSQVLPLLTFQSVTPSFAVAPPSGTVLSAAAKSDIEMIVAAAMTWAPPTPVHPAAPGGFVAEAISRAARSATATEQSYVARLDGAATGIARLDDRTKIVSALSVLPEAALAMIRKQAVLMAQQAHASAQYTAPTASAVSRLPSFAPTAPTYTAPTVSALAPAPTVPSVAPTAPLPPEQPRHADPTPPEMPLFAPTPEPYVPGEGIYPRESGSDDSSGPAPGAPTAPWVIDGSGRPPLPESAPQASSGPASLFGVPWYYWAGGGAALAVVGGGLMLARRRSPTPNRRRRARR